ncbi:TPA: hypothetical protein QCX07_004030 [Bacillus cytotoxicus]|nr:hypothetical protein CG483_010960 [Bacillus cytotoxicus]QTR67069.1 hypothetical protein JC776_20285 [Bacillus cytotoxicus]SCN36815.1 Transposase [Bacillus cytotoxicus]HDR7210765.1 hypothetical protein [Bacillus cytotoxicus]HDR7297145.1 hypothetical protein [Bacillus cytotoxicus]
MNLKADYLHKVSADIIKNYGVICMEDLQVSNVLKNHKLAKHHVHNLAYKAKCYAKEVVAVSKTFASSQT